MKILMFVFVFACGSISPALAQDAASVDLVKAAAICRLHFDPIKNVAQPGWEDCIDVLAALYKAEAAVKAAQSIDSTEKQNSDRSAVRALAKQLKDKK